MVCGIKNFSEMDSEGALQPVTLGRNLSRKHHKSVGWIPENRYARNALFFSILQCIIAGALEIYIAIMHRSFVDSLNVLPSTKAIGEAIIAYHSIFIISQFFQLILLYDAVSVCFIPNF